MQRKYLREALEDYARSWGRNSAPEEAGNLNRFVEFIETSPFIFERNHLVGHITGSALVVDRGLERVLLTLHAKLNRWLQLGGHCDGDEAVHRAALREAEEESGLAGLAFYPYESIFQLGDGAHPLSRPLILDVDVHEIPQRGTEPAHHHYDVRYLLMAENPEAIAISKESTDLAWHSLARVGELTQERSMHRQFDKVRHIKNKQAFA